ncbi:S-adenosylmethionine decarboxylase [Candidatus Woesearchaeota archaeon CG10_big_fil_rev_8_21_14_0_10_45_16]|nr:MAG: S-adenosylmethionine decarboxylase [Candidatus Woesearchaeota archaeon CG10_big_fil_rev_8_21_14_0_10_45_16]
MAKNWWWGRSASVDLHGCDAKLLSDPKAIARFVRGLVKELNMVRVGPPEIKRFGHGKLRGYSMMQFIETSTIVAHFDEQGGRAFIDIFSCKKYNAKKMGVFCKKFFKASEYKVAALERK